MPEISIITTLGIDITGALRDKNVEQLCHSTVRCTQMDARFFKAAKCWTTVQNLNVENKGHQNWE